MTLAIVLALLLGEVLRDSVAVALPNNLSLTPTMGFNNWDEMPLHYKPWAGGFNESEVKRVGAALVSSGMRDLGYVYLNLDCGWSTGYRAKNETLQVNAKLFPSSTGGRGFKPLADHLHEIGLKLGIYTSGHQCCSPKDGTDGSEGKELEDAQQFADWGIDYVKDDDCGSSAAHFEKMRDAIAATGRPMVYSIHSPWTHHPTSPSIHPSPAEAVALCNSARTTNDITPEWATILDRAHTNNGFRALAGPGYFNDPDMLEIGNSKLSAAEGRSQMALWSLMKAPLLSGTDVSRATTATIKTLTAKEIIAVNQDVLGVQGHDVTAMHGHSSAAVWTGPLSGNCSVALVINTGSAPLSTTLTWTSLGLPAGAKMTVRDLWAGEDQPVAAGRLSVSIETTHDNAMYKLCPATHTN